MKNLLYLLDFICVFLISWITCAPIENTCADVAVVTGEFKVYLRNSFDRIFDVTSSLDKGPNLDGRYILKTRSDEKPADACVNGCIYFKGNCPKILKILNV